ncbi:bZIP transcription factor 29-like [Zingiber officinale]|uniref:bZIP transcription factor 29-like n=1 Tax=Zingiber officinale TaxID=94328 RepID=UPI001C4C60F2|nr:bZIP transcription factor 29-like [Zingiber officinale]
MEESRTDLMQCFRSSSASAASSVAATSSSPYSPSFIPRPPGSLDLPNFGPTFRHFTPSFSPDTTAAKRPGIPPIPPSPTSSTAALPFHSRSLSQSHAFDSLAHLPSSPAPSPPPPLLVDPMMVDDRAPSSRTPTPRDGLPPRRVHRRSHSDVPFGLPLPSPPASRPVSSSKQLESSGGEAVRAADCSKSGVAAVDDLMFAYMDSLDTLISSGTEDRHEDLVECSRLSGTKTSGADSSENEAESSVNESGGDGGCRGERKEGHKRTAAVDPKPSNSRHRRSISMDSFVGKLHFGDDSPKFPPSPGGQMGQLLRSGSMDETMNTFNLELGNGEFNAAEMKKIMADEKLTEMALADPKKVKRILANRISAARSKERKMRYISELEHKVQILQTEATTLSAQLTMLQRDSAGLTNQNNELKFRLQAMEQQAHLKDALNEQLSAEVQRLKLASGEISEAQLSKNMNQQMQLSPQLFQLHQLPEQQQHHQQQKQQIAQAPPCQLPPPQQTQNNVSAKLESSRC